MAATSARRPAQARYVARESRGSRPWGYHVRCAPDSPGQRYSHWFNAEFVVRQLRFDWMEPSIRGL